jgi:uncharacterized protein YhbP (UPF0306 family)
MGNFAALNKIFMSNNLDKKIIDFIGEHHVLSLATVLDNKPYTSNCFYVYLPKENAFIFTSDPETTHAKHMLDNANVGLNIFLETKAVGKIQGLQITGEVKVLDGDDEKSAKLAYLKEYPFAILKMETMWKVFPNFMKLTDNRLGFGKKIIWKK